MTILPPIQETGRLVTPPSSTNVITDKKQQTRRLSTIITRSDPFVTNGNPALQHRLSPLPQQIPVSISRLIGVSEDRTKILLNCCRLGIDESGVCQVLMFNLRSLAPSALQAVLETVSESFKQEILRHGDFMILYSYNEGRLFEICPIARVSGNSFDNFLVELSHNGSLVDNTVYALECSPRQVKMMVGKEPVLTFDKQTESETLLFFQKFASRTQNIFLSQSFDQVSFVLKVSQSVTARNIFFAVVENTKSNTRTLAIPNRYFASRGYIKIQPYVYQIEDRIFQYPLMGDDFILIENVIPDECLGKYKSHFVTALNYRIEDDSYSFSLRPRPGILSFYGSLPLTKVDKPSSLYTRGFSIYLSPLPGVMEAKHLALKILMEILLGETTNDKALIKEKTVKDNTFTRPAKVILEYSRGVLEYSPGPERSFIFGDSVFIGHYLDRQNKEFTLKTLLMETLLRETTNDNALIKDKTAKANTLTRPATVILEYCPDMDPIFNGNYFDNSKKPE